MIRTESNICISGSFEPIFLANITGCARPRKIMFLSFKKWIAAGRSSRPSNMWLPTYRTGPSEGIPASDLTTVPLSRVERNTGETAAVSNLSHRKIIILLQYLLTGYCVDWNHLPLWLFKLFELKGSRQSVIRNVIKFLPTAIIIGNLKDGRQIYPILLTYIETIELFISKPNTILMMQEVSILVKDC